MRGIAGFGQAAGWTILILGGLVALFASVPGGIAMALSAIVYLLFASLLDVALDIRDEMRLARAEAMQRAGWVPVAQPVSAPPPYPGQASAGRINEADRQLLLARHPGELGFRAVHEMEFAAADGRRISPEVAVSIAQEWLRKHP